MTTIMTVCTGNICRSPAAELLLGSYLGDFTEVRSSGTHAMAGERISAPMLRCLDGDAIDGRGHRATQLTADLIRSTDLVITMTAAHRRWAIAEAPFAARRIVMLEELAAAAREQIPLVGSTPNQRLASAAEAVDGIRSPLAPMDVTDPYGGTQAEYDAVYTLIRTSTRAIADWLTA